jgi:hypothetical protein
MKKTKRISGQVVYCGPSIPQLGLPYGIIFRDGIFEHIYKFIEQCPSLGELFVPIKNYSQVRLELNFDLGRNMRGTSGKFVTFYREVQHWLATKSKETKAPPTTGVKLLHHA